MTSRVLTEGTSSSGLLGLVKAIHDRVVQHLCGASLALSAVDWNGGTALHRASEEVATALGELQELLAATLEGIAPDLPPAGVAPTSEVTSVLLSVVTEALVNARKHAASTRISIEVSTDTNGVTMEVRNDGQSQAAPGTGLGLRIAALEVRQLGGSLHSSATDDGGWRFRVDLPQ